MQNNNYLKIYLFKNSLFIYNIMIIKLPIIEDNKIIYELFRLYRDNNIIYLIANIKIKNNINNIKINKNITEKIIISESENSSYTNIIDIKNNNKIDDNKIDDNKIDDNKINKNNYM